MRRCDILSAAAIWVLTVVTAAADVAEVSDQVIGPAYARFAEEAAALDAAARRDCSAEALRTPYQSVWDAWAVVDFFRLGPVEEGGRSLAISFWPDPKSSGRRAQQAVADGNAAVIDDPAAFAKLSVAARGLSGLERLIHAPGITGEEDILCRMRQATAADLARMAGGISAEWAAFDAVLKSAGEPENTRYLTPQEARQAVYTQLVSGLEYLADTRIGRPLGTGEKPRPERAEARAAGRSLRNVVLSLTGIRDLAMALQPDAEQTRDAFAGTIAMAEELDDPVFAGVATPAGQEALVALQRSVRATKRVVETEIGLPLGLGVGFNSRDGD